MGAVRLDDDFVTLSKSSTIAGWIVIAVAIAATWLGARLSRGRFATGVATIRTATSHVAVRIVAFASWAWIGWHFFVRTSR